MKNIITEVLLILMFVILVILERIFKRNENLKKNITNFLGGKFNTSFAVLLYVYFFSPLVILPFIRGDSYFTLKDDWLLALSLNLPLLFALYKTWFGGSETIKKMLDKYFDLNALEKMGVKVDEEIRNKTIKIRVVFTIIIISGMITLLLFFNTV